ncbi:hypothetical protein [Haloarcula nitratireducens]|uniref:Uncharacterized protein n=1 Tax=Haloarcula nitratireducens TaxID=2487749 RepID=A0AAW4PJX5_9EURY|nr:hypothetical protein [Halomicroarcula nitratireducens]MBX0297522.1 hypothetical protein [Halomicroarcula nitratireducens]
MPQGEKTVTDTEIVQWMYCSAEPAFTTAEVAENFNITVEGMRGRLENLQDRKLVCRKKPTPRAVIWWIEVDHDESAFSA